MLSLFLWMVAILSAANSVSRASFVRNAFSPWEHRIILSSIGKVQAAKLDEVLKKARAFFD
jgi:hypothetical protein